MNERIPVQIAMTTTSRDLPSELRRMAGDVESAGWPDQAALLRLSAERIENQADIVDAYREHSRELGQYLIEAHKSGAVDEAAVAILDGYHIGMTEVAGGAEPAEHTLAAALRLLKLAAGRGAYIKAPQGIPDLPATAGYLRQVGRDMATDDPAESARIMDWAEVVDDAHALAVYLVDAHAPGKVDAAAACAVGEGGRTPPSRALQLLKLAMSRGAYGGHTP